MGVGACGNIGRGILICFYTKSSELVKRLDFILIQETSIKYSQKQNNAVSLDKNLYLTYWHHH